MFLDHRVCFVSRRAQSISDIKKSLKPPLINRIAPLNAASSHEAHIT